MFKNCTWYRYTILVLVCFLSVSYEGFAKSEIDAKTVGSYLGKHCSEQQLRFLFDEHGSWQKSQFSGAKIIISAQLGESDVEKFRNALSLAKAGDTLIGTPHMVIDIKGRPIELPAGVALIGNWMEITSSIPVSHLLGVKDDTQHYYISRVTFNGAGNDSSASLFMRGVEYVTIENNVFVNTGKSGLTIQSSKNNGAKYIRVANNYMHSPAKGIAHTLFIKSKFDGPYIKCVLVSDNVVYGAQPSKPRVEDYTAENEFSADQIVLHGVKGFMVSDNYSAWSGSAGFTVSRMSSDGIIYNNIAEMCYEPGFNIGSGYEAIYVKDINVFNVGDTVKGEGRARFEVKAKLADTHSRRGWLRGNARGDWLVQGEQLKIEGADETISSVLKVERATNNLIVLNNNAIETGIQGNENGHYGAFNAIRSDNLRLQQNTYSTKLGKGLTDKIISLSITRAYLDDNSPSYDKNKSEYQLAGPKTEILKD